MALKAIDGSGREWEVRARLGEAITAVEYVCYILGEEENLHLFKEIKEKKDVPMWSILRKGLKGRLGPFITSFIVPADEEEAEDYRDVEAEWHDIRKALGFTALPQVIFGFLASPEVLDMLKETETVRATIQQVAEQVEAEEGAEKTEAASSTASTTPAS